ncbi:hypothetical protein [Streptomyces sp. A30]|uniref:hypothetical protein n=1 Tax=Streptomyces sp. A30 TaxID=2789273 RepID=UPI0039806AE1
MTIPGSSSIDPSLVHDDGGQYDFNDGTWWSNRYQRWFRLDFREYQCAYAEIRVCDKGSKTGATLFRNLLTLSGIYHKYTFELIARRAGIWVDAVSPTFVVLCYSGDSMEAVDHMQSWETGAARQALDALHRDAVYRGWIPQQQTGVHWYSYTYLLPRPLID